MGLFVVDWQAINYCLGYRDGLRDLPLFGGGTLGDRGVSVEEYRGLVPRVLLTGGESRGYRGPGHVLVPPRASNRTYEDLVRHRWGSPLPKGAFYDIGGSVWVATPWFAFLQMARRSSVALLAYTVCCLCASYTYGRDGGLLSTRALTTSQALRAHLGTAPLREKARADAALSTVTGSAASPAEVRAALRLSLPTSEGGLGLPPVVLNCSIPTGSLPKEILDKSDRTRFDVDLYWPSLGIGVEYDGEGAHSKDWQRERDRKRRNSLAACGARLFVIKKEELGDSKLLERLARQVAHAAGLELPVATEDDLKARAGLIRMLDEYGW